MFSITYKQKNASFHKLFPSIDKKEKLLVDYSCALQKEILIQGKLYISQHYVCFHANIFGWETALQIHISKIKNIRKATTVKFIPNAIILDMKDEDQLGLTPGFGQTNTALTTPQSSDISRLNSHDSANNSNSDYPNTCNSSNFASANQNQNQNLSALPDDTTITTATNSTATTATTTNEESTFKFTSFLDRNTPFNVIYNLLQVYNSGEKDEKPQTIEENSVLWALVLKRYHSANDLTELLTQQGWKKPTRSQSALRLDQIDASSNNVDSPKSFYGKNNNNNVGSDDTSLSTNHQHQSRKYRHKSNNVLPGRGTQEDSSVSNYHSIQGPTLMNGFSDDDCLNSDSPSESENSMSNSDNQQIQVPYPNIPDVNGTRPSLERDHKYHNSQLPTSTSLPATPGDTFTERNQGNIHQMQSIEHSPRSRNKNQSSRSRSNSKKGVRGDVTFSSEEEQNLRKQRKKSRRSQRSRPVEANEEQMISSPLRNQHQHNHPNDFLTSSLSNSSGATRNTKDSLVGKTVSVKG